MSYSSFLLEISSSSRNSPWASERPRIVRRGELMQLCASHGATSARTQDRWVAKALSDGALVRAWEGVFVNPSADVSSLELAPFAHPGAIVSLQTALAHHHVIHKINRLDVVVPISDTRGTWREVQLGAGMGSLCVHRVRDDFYDYISHDAMEVFHSNSFRTEPLFRISSPELALSALLYVDRTAQKRRSNAVAWLEIDHEEINIEKFIEHSAFFGVTSDAEALLRAGSTHDKEENSDLYRGPDIDFS